MQAIITKYLGPTISRGSRIKAKCERGSITIPYPYEAPIGAGAHRVAAQALVDKFIEEDFKRNGTSAIANPWSTPFVTGSTPPDAYVHVFVS